MADLHVKKNIHGAKQSSSKLGEKGGFVAFDARKKYIAKVEQNFVLYLHIVSHLGKVPYILATSTCVTSEEIMQYIFKACFL